MKARVPLLIALLAGLMMGGAGVWLLCEAGHCGTGDSAGVVESPATGTAAVLSSGTAIVVAATPSPAIAESPTTTEITGLAVIGDSTTDEYRADDARGSDYARYTYSWVELLAGQDRVNVGTWSDDRAEPRRGGYAFNWARSGDTTATMIAGGQHSGVAEQIEAGQVSHVIIQIGINDFHSDNIALSIYNGQLAGEELQGFLDGMVTNLELAVHTVKLAGADGVIVSSVPDFIGLGLLPEAEEVLPDSAGRQRVIDAFSEVNQRIAVMAAREQVQFFDFNAALTDQLASRVDPADPRFILVGGQRIDLVEKGDNPHHFFVGDDFAHPGTVASGLFANLFITELNGVFGTDVAPFGDDELLCIAGIDKTGCAQRGQVSAP